METLSCPKCSHAVRREADSCPSCGVDLRFTVADTPSGFNVEPSPGLEFTPGQVFAERFTIIEKIGAGGMGVVYKAIDNELDSEVTLKVIQPLLANLPAFTERFRREVRITRQITHPNICRVHDIGTFQESLFLSMEWIDGETLQQLLRQTGMLRESRALQIAGKIAAALEAAHDKGIVHRDLKPANVMLDQEGHVYVLDFGLALDPDSDALTGEGVLLGTLPYMSPEQRRGEKLDGRSDLYTLGLILREMLIGRRTDPESSPDELPSEVNPTITPVLQRLLARNPDDRYRSAGEAREALEELRQSPGISVVTSTVPFFSVASGSRGARHLRLGVGLTVVVAVLVIVAYFMWPASDETGLSHDARAFYDSGLRHLDDLSDSDTGVRQAVAMFQRALDTQPDSPLLLARLGEAYWVLFRRTRSAEARRHAELNLDRASKLDPSLPELQNARAIGYIIEGKFKAAEESLNSALTARPEFTMAWVNLGDVYMETERYADGLEALALAMELEPGNSRVQLFFGLFHEHFGEYTEALRYYRRATELKPASSIAWQNYGAALLYTNRLEEAIPALERSIANGERPRARSNLGTAYYLLGRHDEAVEQYRRATELEPDDPGHWGNLGDELEAVGEPEEAAEAYRQAAERAAERAVADPLNPSVVSDLALYCAKAGDLTCALENGRRATELQPGNARILRRNAAIFCRLGRDEECLDWLDRAVTHGESRAQIEATPEFEHLKSLERFRALLELAP